MLRPSADLVGFGWLGFGFFVGGTSCVRGILLGIFTKSGCVLGKGVGIRAWGVTLPDRLGGSPIKFGSLVNRTVLGGFLRCHGGEGPTGLLSFCVLVDLKVKVQATVGLAAGSCIPLPPAVFLGSLTFPCICRIFKPPHGSTRSRPGCGALGSNVPIRTTGA